MLLFNGPVEVGIRTVILLDAVFPEALDLHRITILDHWALHSGMLSNLPSVHPDRANSLGELGLKKGLIEQGIQLMRSAGMVSVIVSSAGISYRATEEAAGFLSLRPPGVRGGRPAMAGFFFAQYDHKSVEMC